MNRRRINMSRAVMLASPTLARHIAGRSETIERLTGATLLDDEAVVAESGLDIGALDGAAILI